ncbi:MAG: membrane protein insertase YidC [Spirochaetales bacterium]|nr:membrane protein insertase YidC [Spirochaetales bacterium]
MTTPPAERKPTVNAAPLTTAIKEETATLHSKIFTVTFSNKGAVATSILLNDPAKDPDNTFTEGDIEMVFAYRQDASARVKAEAEYPFALHFGGYQTPAADDLYQVTQGDGKVEFSRVYEMAVPAKNDKGEDKETVKRVKVKKTFSLDDDLYLVKMNVSLESEAKEAIPFDFNGVMYTLGIAPQIGPDFPNLKPDGQSDYRQFVVLANSGRKEFGMPPPPEPFTDSFSWAAIAGKYYAVIASTNANVKDLILTSRDVNVPFQHSAMYFERKSEETQLRTDEYTFFIGPKKRDVLDSYQNMKYGDVMPGSFLGLGFIADILKYPLDFLYMLVQNYGVAIILLTLLIKLLLFPLTRKSFDSMQKMQAVNPKLQEIRTKYKDNPKRMNEEMAALYKREGISPLGGCLPQLLQLPILFALYQLLSTHFALKGAVFIPGWIPDLSVPEFLWKFPGGPVTIPLLITQFTIYGISLLPFIMLGTQLLSTMITQGKSQNADSRMKYLPYIMMALFFFILYNMPSGLVLYWTVQNVLTVVQMLIQKYFSDRKKKMQAAT